MLTRHCCLSPAEKKDYPTTLGRHIAPTREWVLTDVVDKSQLEDRERVREKLRKLSQLSHEVQRRFKESEMRARRSTFEAETARRSALRLRHQEEVALRLKLH